MSVHVEEAKQVVDNYYQKCLATQSISTLLNYISTLEEENRYLKEQVTNMGWELNPDRMGQ